jgi:ribosomal subunit interface protein
MNITIESPFKLSEEDKESIHEKLKELTKFESNIVQCQVYFKTGDGTAHESVQADIRVAVRGNDIFVSERDHDAIKAFSSAHATAKRQLRKRKEKIKKH